MSSNDLAISIRGLSKSYTIAHGVLKRPTFREVVMDRAHHLFRSPLAGLRSSSETFWALKDVSFDVKKGEVVGIIGRNGAGKSTLLKILSRITEPTTGRIEVYGRVGSLLEVGTGFHPELTGRENIFLNGAILGMNRGEIRKQFDAIVDFAEVEKFIDTPVKRYSSGMYVRLAFAVAAHLNPEILIVDEVLAVGDAEFQKKCLGKMGEVAAGGRTVLFVSHNMAAVARLCTRAIYLDSGAVRYDGSVASSIELYSNTAVYAGERAYDGGPVRQITAVDRGGCIEISVDCNVERIIRVVSLGFVIRNLQGTSICGCNPSLSGAAPAAVVQPTGRVRALVRSPRLRSGSYLLSVWVGDGTTDCFEAIDALTFHVGTPSPGDERSMALGPVVPEVDWIFSGAN